MAPGEKAGDRQEGMHQMSGHSLLGPRLWPKSQAVKGVKAGTEPPAEKFRKERDPDWWALEVWQGYQLSCLPYTQFQDRTQSLPSQDLLENQEGPKGRGRMLTLTLEGQEDCLQLLSTFPAQPFIPKPSTCQSAINNQESE